MKILKKLLKVMHPIPKIGTGEDFSYIGAHLLTDQNKWITGQIFHIDGGRSSLRIKS
jgi:enoyl-[acyl-carrier-protein] reductase (NADH)